MLKIFKLIVMGLLVSSCASTQTANRGLASVHSSETLSASEISTRTLRFARSSKILNVIVENVSDDGSGCYINKLMERLSASSGTEVLVNVFILPDVPEKHDNLIMSLYRVPIDIFRRENNLYLPGLARDFNNQDDDVEIKIMSEVSETGELLYQLNTDYDKIESLVLNNSTCN